MKNFITTLLIFGAIFGLVLVGTFAFEKFGGIEAIGKLDTTIHVDLNKVIHVEERNDNQTDSNSEKSSDISINTNKNKTKDKKVEDKFDEVITSNLLPYPKRNLSTDEIFKEDLELSKSLGITLSDVLPQFVKKSNVGVLLIHGLSATPKHMEYFSTLVSNAGFSYYNARVAGHGTSVEDLKSKTYVDWYNSLQNGYNTLASFCDKIIIVGESNGGILAAAIAKFNKVDAIVLSAPAFALNESIFKDGSEDINRNINSKYFQTYNYNIFPGESVKQVNALGALATEFVADLKIPVLFAVSENDIAIDSKKVVDVYLGLNNPNKDLLLYSNKEYGITHVLLAKEFKGINEDVMSWIKKVIKVNHN